MFAFEIGNQNMILFLWAILEIASTNLIISVTPNNPQVSAQQLIDISVLTTTTIPNNALTIIFPTDFTLTAPCRVNATNSTCTYSATTTAANVVFSNSFASATYYTLSVTVTNPVYATNFQISASVAGVAFANSAVVTITPKSITCSMLASSPYVGDTAGGQVILINDQIPANSVIVISSPLQSTFSNLFASSPSCSSPAGGLSCSLSTSFGQQFLTITNVPTQANLSLSIRNVNNAPYNSSLISASLQIQNQNSYNMQICNFSQPIPTSLRDSIGAVIQNWNSSVGATSDVTLTVSTFFTPYTTRILFAYDSNFTISALSPTSTTSIATAGNWTYNYLSGGVPSGKTLSFLIRVVNPPTQQPVSFSIYVIFSNTLFIEQYHATTFSLTSLSLDVDLTLASNKTMTLSAYNCSTVIDNPIPNNPIITVSARFGTIQCSNLNLISNFAPWIVNCSESMLAVSTSALSRGNLWLTFNVANYMSVRSDNFLMLVITGPAPSFYGIGSGSASINLTVNNQAFTIVNSNTTFAAPTSFSIAQASVLITATQARTFAITYPPDLQLTATNTKVIAASDATTIDSYTIVTSTNTININARGLLRINISSLSNPIRYQAILTWTFTVTDLDANPSSISTSTQSPAYTPTTASTSLTLTNPVIESTSNLTLTIIPSLQYITPPNITITIPNSLIQIGCSACTLLSASTITFLYTTAIMKVTIQVQNSNNPNNNSISLVISNSNVTFEVSEVNYTLEPMTYEYVSSQTGFYGQLGSVNVTITKAPTTSLSLAYSGLDSVLSGAVCGNCTNRYILASGLIQFFQIATVNLIGTYNGVVYAKASALVYYICSSLQGCRICSNNGSSLHCQMCFNSTFTNYTLLYGGQCLQICPLATYSNGVTCLDCKANCQTCNSSGCLLCYVNYYIYNGSCLTVCPSPLVNNGTHCIEVPIICPTNCANCPTNNRCTACQGGYLLLNDSCFSTCPNNYVKDQSGTGCKLFLPPQEASYFPFAFLISAFLLGIGLIAIKCYQKRSLVMGNLIAFLSIVQIGSMIMTLTYTFQTSYNLDLLAQALIFILIFSKFVLNIIFLIYFIKVIVEEEDFLRWRQAEESHQRLYRVLIVMSSLLSFQCIRIIYSRLMGLRLFFGKFNTSLIFKPLNYFTAAHFVTCGVALVFLSVRNIKAQDGYKTSTFYSGVQSIILQMLLLVCCIIDNKKGYDDEFFEYQVYKVSNEYQSSHMQPVEIQEQAQNACSMHEMLNAIHPTSSRMDNKSGIIVKNPMWVRTTEHPAQLIDVEVQSQPEQEQEEEHNQTGIITNKKESLFRRKIIDDWRKLQKELPRHISFMRRNPKRLTKKQWVSPNSKAKMSTALKRSSSVSEIEVRLPQSTGNLPERIKQYFYNLTTSVQKVPQKEKRVQMKEKQLRSRKQRRLNEDRQFYQQNSVKSVSLEAERDENSQEADPSQASELKVKEQDEYNSREDIPQQNNITNIFQQQPLQIYSHEQYPLEIDQLEEIQEAYTQARSNQGQEEATKAKEISRRPLLEDGSDNRHHKSSQKVSRPLAGIDYRYDESEEKEKRYRVKKRRVNKQTEEVYLQRLAVSSDRKGKPLKLKKLDF